MLHAHCLSCSSPCWLYIASFTPKTLVQYTCPPTLFALFTAEVGSPVLQSPTFTHLIRFSNTLHLDANFFIRAFVGSHFYPSLFEISVSQFRLVMLSTSPGFLSHAKIALPLDVRQLQIWCAVMQTFLVATDITLAVLSLALHLSYLYNVWLNCSYIRLSVVLYGCDTW